MKQRPSAVLGRWPIVEIEGRDADFIDTLGQGYFQSDPDGGRIELGAIQIGLECRYGPAGAHFDFHGSDEGTEVSDDGDAEIEGGTPHQ